MGRSRKVTSDPPDNPNPPYFTRNYNGDGPKFSKRHTKSSQSSWQNRNHSRTITTNVFHVSEGDFDETDQMFPKFTPLLVFLVTSSIRVYYVLQPPNWWMLHPDEVFQSMEIANIESKGYGFLPHEFSPPEESGSDVTLYRQVELRAGMAALRSPVLPYFYTLVYWLVTSVWGPVGQPYHLWRVVHAIVSSCLPLAVYRYVIKTSQSKDVANIATIITAISSHLTMFGTHTLIHSFLSPFNFLTLSLLVEIFNPDWPSIFQMVRRIRSAFLKNVRAQTTGLSLSPYKGDIQGNNRITLNTGSDRNNNTNNNNTNDNNNSTSNNNNNKNTINNNKNYNKEDKAKSTNPYFLKNPNDCSHNSKSEIRSDTNKPTHSSENLDLFPQLENRAVVVLMLKTFTAGWLCGLTVYVRPDVSLLYFASVVIWSFTSRRLTSTVTMTTALIPAVVSGLGLATLADRWYYGRWTSSLVNWLKFNVLHDTATAAYGSMSSLQYVYVLFWRDLSTLWPSLACVAAVAYVRLRTPRASPLNTNKTSTQDPDPEIKIKTFWKPSIQFLITFILLLCAYSTKGHKETRFIHDVIVLLFIFLSYSIYWIVQYVTTRSSKRRLLVLLCVSLISSLQYTDFPDRASNTGHVYQSTVGVQDTNACLDYISSQPRVSGVFMDADIFMTGGLALLQHDVPIITLTGNGYYGFDPKIRRTLSTRGRHKSVHEFTRASNYFSTGNPGAVAKEVFLDPRYDFLVLRRDAVFVDFGFKEVFTSGSRRVLRRLRDTMSEHRLKLAAEKVPTIENRTVLLHEADVLCHMGQWRQAASRLNGVISLDGGTVEAYPVLKLAYHKMGDPVAARRVFGRCSQLFGQDACRTPRRLTGA